MKRYYAQTKAQRQADWLARFADAIATRAPHLSGRIEWDTAKHYYFSGIEVGPAVDQYLMARNSKGV